MHQGIFGIQDCVEMKSTASLCHRLDLLMSIRFDLEKETFDGFKGRFTKLLLELKERGEIISPAIQRYVLLRAMPNRYEALVQSLKINDTLTIEEVYTHIKDYWEADLRRHRSVSNRDRSDYANTSIAATIQERKKCYVCGSRKHLARYCQERAESSDSDPGMSDAEGTSSDHDDKKKAANEKLRKAGRRLKKGEKHHALGS